MGKAFAESILFLQDQLILREIFREQHPVYLLNHADWHPHLRKRKH